VLQQMPVAHLQRLGVDRFADLSRVFADRAVAASGRMLPTLPQSRASIRETTADPAAALVVHSREERRLPQARSSAAVRRRPST
jgi:hypothetical protein